MGAKKEKRRESRHPIQMDVVHGSVTIGIAENVSRHGLQMSCVQDLSVGEEIALSLELSPQQTLPVTGTVMWQQPTDAGYQVGIEVREATPEWNSLVGEIEGRSHRQSHSEPPSPRSAPRIPARLPARFGRKSSQEESGFVRDIGPGGVGLEGPLDVEQGEVIFVRFDVPTGESADLIGQVVWRNPRSNPPRIGVKLQSANEGYYRLLARFSSTILPAARVEADVRQAQRPQAAPAAPSAEVLEQLEAMRAQDPFTLLGIGPTDSETEIEQAFFATARRLNPSRLASGPNAEIMAAAKEMFSLVSGAHRRLKDPAERARIIAELSSAAPANEESRDDDQMVPVALPRRRSR